MLMLTKQNFIRVFLVFTALSAHSNLGAQSTDERSSRPNFVLIIADDMAAHDCGAMGHPNIKTPNLDQLATEGLTFEKAFLTCSSCSPSRCSIITSKYPHQTNAEQLHWPLPADQTTFVQLLREAGYFTAASGKWHLGPSAKDHFDLVHPKSSTVDPASQFSSDSPVVSDINNASGCADWIYTIHLTPTHKPFFLWLAAADPHRDYATGILKQPHVLEDVIVPPFIPDTPEVRKDFAQYYDEIARLDYYVGEIRKELVRSGRDQDTYIIFMSDNGRPFPRCKTTVLDSGIQTPLFIRVPKSHDPAGDLAGKRTAALVSSIDIGTTILDLAGIDPDAAMMGQSFRPTLENPNAQHREYIFSEHNWHDYDAHQRAVRSADYSYVRNFDYDLTLSPPADAVRSATYREMQKLRDSNQLSEEQKQCFVAPRQIEELYDLKADPHQLVNVADQPEFASVLSEFRSELEGWRLKTYDRTMTVRAPDEFDRESGKGLKDIPLRVGKFDGFQPMFKDENLSGWKRTNTHPSTWTFADGVLKCTGKPIGELRTERMYQNFIMEVEWRHLVPKGNAGIFVWADDIPAPGVPFHRGIEVQVLENAYGDTQSHTTHGDIFPIHGAMMIPINGRGGRRAFPTELRSKPAPEWNHYRIVCNDGEIALSVNGTIVTRGKNCFPKKGYICLESEGGVVEYRNVQIKEQPDTPITASEMANADRGFECLYTGIDFEGWKAQPEGHWTAQDWFLAVRSDGKESSLSTERKHRISRFIIDAKLLDKESHYKISIGDVTINSQDLSHKYTLAQAGEWSRIEVEASDDRSIVTVQGGTKVHFASISVAAPVVIQATGSVDFANIFMVSEPN